jgi:hypothetical protein
MATSYTPRCEGRRRKQRGHVFGTFACGRKARFVFQTYVGLSRTHYVCGGDDGCVGSITSGYPANNMRELGK